jgi:nucleoside-diphosphate-sugar epimerase
MQGIEARTGQRILVTGGAGFVGFHLCDCLITDGQAVCCVDNLSTGRERNLNEVLGHPQFQLISDDITINLGNAAEFTIAELADTILSLTGSKSKIVRLPLPADDPVKRRPDLSSARDVLAWRPGVSLREGLLRTIVYFDALLRQRRVASNAGAGTRPAFRTDQSCPNVPS